MEGGLRLPKGLSLWEGGSESSLHHVPTRGPAACIHPLSHVLAGLSPDGSAPACSSKGVGMLPPAPRLTANTILPGRSPGPATGDLLGKHRLFPKQRGRVHADHRENTQPHTHPPHPGDLGVLGCASKGLCTMKEEEEGRALGGSRAGRWWEAPRGPP